MLPTPDKDAIKQQARENPEELKEELMSTLKMTIKAGQTAGIGEDIETQKAFYKDLKKAEGEEVGDVIIKYMEEKGVF